jgi:hypothetical protein
MKKFFILMTALIAWAASLSAQNITREQADAAALNHFRHEMTEWHQLDVRVDMTEEEGFVITTSRDETVMVKHPCWVYHLRNIQDPDGPVQVPSLSHRYLLVKKDNGSISELTTNSDFDSPGLHAWQPVGNTSCSDNPEADNNRLLYPNPVGDQLTFSCNGENASVKIYDLKGTCLYSGTISGEDACRLSVSFLNAGIYMVNVSGEIYKMIKK